MTSAKSILLYVRPWNVEQLAHLARGVWGAEARIALTSEHQAVDETRLTREFRTAYRRAAAHAAPRLLTPDQTADIILRCRLLRSLDKAQARRLLVAMEHAVDTVLDETRPEAMLSLTVDSYVMDVFAHLCGLRGIPFLGLVPSFLKDHFRLSARGEPVDSRDVTSDEIDAALSSMIVKDYRPDFLVQSDREMNLQTWRLWMRNLPKPLWFALRRMMPGERLNYHYWATQMIARLFWTPWPRKIESVSGQALANLRGDSGLPLVYLPLQMSPEATVDYWSADTRWIDYETFIVELIRRNRDRVRFVVKEHPNLVGYRTPGFYRRITALPNCIMAAPKVPSNDLVDLCQAVVVCTGTAGFEAALRGKPVFSDARPYYAPPGILLPLSGLEGDIPALDHTPERQKALMAHALSCNLPGRFLNNGTWTGDNPEHRAWSETMAASIRSYLDRTAA